MDEIQTSTQPVEGSTEGTVSQVTDSVPQGANQQQDSGQAEVDSSVTRDSSQTPDRVNNSSHFYKERKRFDKIEKSISDLNLAIQTMAQNLSSGGKTEQNKASIDQSFWDAPDQWTLNKLQENERNITEKVMNELGQKEKQKLIQSEALEALDILLPKDPKNPNEPLESRIERNNSYLEKLDAISREYDLGLIWQKSPKKAANILMKIANEKAIDRTIPTKQQLATTVSGSGQVSGGKPMNNWNEIYSKNVELRKQLESNPELRYNPQFQQQLDNVKKEMTRLMDEKKKG